jgi:hypothetical protein
LAVKRRYRGRERSVLLLIVVIWGIAAAQAIEAYPTLVGIERVILWVWIVALCTALANTLTRNAAFAVALGISLVSVGSLVLFNVRRAADHLAKRQTGMWVFRRTISAARWRICAAIVATTGVTFLLDPSSVP